MKKINYSLLLTLLIFNLFSLNAGKHTVYVIGDSTASLYASSLYPRTGWAQVLQAFLNPDSIFVNDQAASGRSSKSYYNEGKWTKVMNQLKSGDYVFIQFAHNDEKTTDTTRYTNPATTFKYYITTYINGARSKGAYPVLLSSIPRNNWSSTGIQQAHKAYTESMKQMADSLNVPFIDMEAVTMSMLNKKGKAYATDSVYNNLPANVWVNYPTGNSDNTHLQENGAYLMCKTAVEQLKSYQTNSELTPLANNFRQAAIVKAMPDPDLKGTVTGYGVYAKGSTVKLTAYPTTGYRFVKWTSSNDTVTISKNTTYSFNIDTTDVSLIARFEIISGISELVDKSEFFIYPNPATDNVSVQTKYSNFQLNILDLSGRILKSENNCTTLNLSGILPGTYIVRFNSNSSFQKLIIQ